jgi:multimeric flavodoxin WrbA
MSQPVKVLGLHLSPRRDGSSMALLKKFGEGVAQAGAEFEYLSISELDHIRGCMECNYCNDKGICSIDDAMKIFYQAFELAKRIVVATPIFFYDIPAQGKAVVDRSQALWSRRYVMGQNREGVPGTMGFLLAVGATRGKDLFTGVSLSMKYFFDALGFPKVFDSLFFRKIETAKDLTAEQLNAAKTAGHAFAKKP